VRVAATGTTVAGNLIGLDKAGSSALANGASGVEVAGTPGVVTVGGAGAAANVISGNGASGVNLTANGAVVKGNLIGTDTTGTTAIGNTDSGVLVAADNDQVGVPGAGNVISGNGGAGIEVDDTADANGAIIKGNRIGTDAAGTAALPNGAAGIEAREAVTIGGTYAGAGNVISANTGPGVVLNGSNPAQSSTVRGNTIGLDLAGAAALGNVGSGIDVEAGPGGFATHAVIGGAGAGNLISANGESGVFSDGTGVTISGNRVGVEADGTTAAGNGASGIRLGPSALNNVIGGDAPADGNLISNSTGDAIAILAGASGNQVKANTGAGNADLFIDLGDDGPGNPGVQGGVLPPVITVAGPQLARGTAPAGATVRVFSKATPATGELEAYLGSASADNTGHWRVDYTFGPTPLPNLKRVVATQTDPIDGTSELSAIALTDAIAPARPTIQSGPDGPTSDATPTFTFTGDPASALECRIDSGPVTACDAGTYTASALGDGPHTFSVTATDLAENTSAAASRSFSVDTQAKTTITKKPKSKIKTKKKKVKVKVKFKSEQGATFKCKLDKAGYKPCTSPYAAKVKSKPGKGMKHKISIKATDPLGNVSKPATVKFKVIRKKK
jgi:hypothetical protein